MRRRDNRKEFKAAYTKFAESFTDYLQALENMDITLNALILGEFQKHDLAMRNFLHFLNGSRKKKFLQKWNQYEKEYYTIKQLGSMGVAVAIASPSVDITKDVHNPEEMIRWEIDRRKVLYKIIYDLLHIANRKYYF